MSQITACITSANIEQTITKAVNAGVTFKNIVKCDSLSVQIVVDRRYYPTMKRLVEKAGGEIRLISQKGILRRLSVLKRRPVLVFGLLLYFVLMFYVPSRIFFIQVDGNRTLTDAQIIMEANHSGLQFGAPRRSIRSERIKNDLLSSLPQLRWAGVNTYGCVAVISVQEQIVPEKKDTYTGVGSIVAKYDGVVDRVVATRGTVMCTVGQAVKKNQILVSGYTDCGLLIRATTAQGEVYGKTARELSSVVPAHYISRVGKVDKEVNFGIIFGKNLIKLKKCSGISERECVKISKEYYLTLPGGFELPVGFVKETILSHSSEVGYLSEEEAARRICNLSQQYLQSTMVAGTVLSHRHQLFRTEEVYVQQEKFACREMIGQYLNEEIFTGND